MSLMVVAANLLLDLEKQEQKAFHLINLMKTRDNLSKNASRVIINLWRIYKIYNMPDGYIKSCKLMFATRRFRSAFYEFRISKQLFINFNTLFDIQDFLVITNDKLRFDFEDLHINQRKIYEGALKARKCLKLNYHKRLKGNQDEDEDEAREDEMVAGSKKNQ